MKKLFINSKEIHSLEALRENFDLGQVIAAFLNCTLERWLEDYFYEKQAEQVRALDHTIGFEVEMELCRILGVDYVAAGYMRKEHRAIYERKCRIIQQHTDGPEFVEHALDTATNQAELAEFLHNGKRRIYLCGSSFHVPISVGGVHYIGIGRPKMEAASTEEQYRHAGITFEGIELPTKIAKETIAAAEKAAAANGYDNFGEKHNALASKLHFAIKRKKLSKHLYLSWNTSVATEPYTSKSSAENDVKREVDTTYDQANSFFTPGNQACLSGTLAEQYSMFIIYGCGDIIEQLAARCSSSETLKLCLQKLEKLIASSSENLRKLFDQELYESSDYYGMYKRSYFHEQINIEHNDYNVDMFDSCILNELARLIHDDSQYTVHNMYETMSELEEDVNSHANTFFGQAFEIYCKYCQEIEKIAEEIGTNLSGEDADKHSLICQR